jgi:hypothetical protein
MRVYQGETVVVEFQVVTTDGEPLDLTASTLQWRLKVSPGLGQVIQEKSPTVTDAELGRLEVVLSTDDTALLPGEYVHELRLAQEATVATVYQGPFTVTRSLFAV